MTKSGRRLGIPGIVVGVLVAIFGVIAIGHAATVIDDFNDNSINTAIWNPGIFGTGPTVVETNQRLESTLPGSTGGSNIYAGLFYKSTLSGDFDIQVDFNLLTWPSANGVRVNIAANGATVERTSFGINGDFGSAPRENYIANIGGVITLVTTSDLSGKLRLIRVGAVYTGCYLSGITWFKIASGPAPTSSTGFDIAARSNTPVFAGKDVKVAFDNVTLDPAAGPCLNQGENTPTSTPTRTPTPTPTGTVTPTVTPTIVAQAVPTAPIEVHSSGAGAGGAAAVLAAVGGSAQQARASQAAAVATAVAGQVAAAQAIRPPNTGDGGLLGR